MQKKGPVRKMSKKTHQKREHVQESMQERIYEGVRESMQKRGERESMVQGGEREHVQGGEREHGEMPRWHKALKVKRQVKTNLEHLGFRKKDWVKDCPLEGLTQF